jgi:hypothetical protein
MVTADAQAQAAMLDTYRHPSLASEFDHMRALRDTRRAGSVSSVSVSGPPMNAAGSMGSPLAARERRSDVQPHAASAFSAVGGGETLLSDALLEPSSAATAFVSPPTVSRLVLGAGVSIGAGLHSAAADLPAYPSGSGAGARSARTIVATKQSSSPSLEDFVNGRSPRAGSVRRHDKHVNRLRTNSRGSSQERSQRRLEAHTEK